jgi:hypothetical protein
VSGARHPSESELLESAIRTIEGVLAPELRTDWAKSAAIGLAGQLRYALNRQAQDSLATQDEALEQCLEKLCADFDTLADVIGAAALRDDQSWNLREQASLLLVHALDRAGPAADAVRTQLRPLLIAQLGHDLGESAPMLHAFLASGSVGSS